MAALRECSFVLQHDRESQRFIFLQTGQFKLCFQSWFMIFFKNNSCVGHGLASFNMHWGGKDLELFM